MKVREMSRGLLRGTGAICAAFLLLGCSSARGASDGPFTLLVTAVESHKHVWFLSVQREQVVPGAALAKAVQHRAGWVEIQLEPGAHLSIRGLSVRATTDDVQLGNQPLGPTRMRL